MAQHFLEAYEDHVWDVYAFFAYRSIPRADAEDLTQLTFERALKAWKRYDPDKSAVATWLLAIARNAYIDYRRRNRPSRRASLSADEVPEGALPTSPGPEETRLGLSPELASAMRRLRKHEREVVALRFGADLRGPEIAELLGLSLGNVQQILSRALRKLRRRLEAQSEPARAEASRVTEKS